MSYISLGAWDSALRPTATAVDPSVYFVSHGGKSHYTGPAVGVEAALVDLLKTPPVLGIENQRIEVSRCVKNASGIGDCTVLCRYVPDASWKWQEESCTRTWRRFVPGDWMTALLMSGRTPSTQEPLYEEQQLPPDQQCVASGGQWNPDTSVCEPPEPPGFWSGLSTVEKVGLVAGGTAVLGLLYYAVTRS